MTIAFRKHCYQDEMDLEFLWKKLPIIEVDFIFLLSERSEY